MPPKRADEMGNRDEAARGALAATVMDWMPVRRQRSAVDPQTNPQGERRVGTAPASACSMAHTLKGRMYRLARKLLWMS